MESSLRVKWFENPNKIVGIKLEQSQGQIQISQHLLLDQVLDKHDQEFKSTSTHTHLSSTPTLSPWQLRQSILWLSNPLLVQSTKSCLALDQTYHLLLIFLLVSVQTLITPIGWLSTTWFAISVPLVEKSSSFNPTPHASRLGLMPAGVENFIGLIYFSQESSNLSSPTSSLKFSVITACWS